MATVELVYDSDCPNVARARGQLLKAFATAKVAARWMEWNRSDPSSPAHVRRYGSPTILVDGQDVAGVAPDEGADSCRIYQGPGGELVGAPTVEEIARALSSPPVDRKDGLRHVARRLLPAAPSSVLSILPIGACPACLPVYAGVLSSLGMSFLLETAYLLPLTIFFFGIALFALGWRARQRRGFGPLVVGIIASLVLITGKFMFAWNAATYGGLGLLIVASLWNAWPQRTKSTAPCPACSGAPSQPN